MAVIAWQRHLLECTAVIVTIATGTSAFWDAAIPSVEGVSVWDPTGWLTDHQHMQAMTSLT